MKSLFVCACVLLLIGCVKQMAESTEHSTYFTMYGSVLTGDTLGELIKGQADYEHDYTFLTFAAGKPLFNISRHLHFGGEVQLAKHFGGQDHLEFNIVLVQRWTAFPWNSYVNTTLAAGEGLSYATALPELELESKGDTEQCLGYLLFEFTIALPSYSQWALSARIHHRSGASGIFSGIYGASNAFGIGLSYYF